MKCISFSVCNLTFKDKAIFTPLYAVYTLLIFT